MIDIDALVADLRAVVEQSTEGTHVPGSPIMRGAVLAERAVKAIESLHAEHDAAETRIAEVAKLHRPVDGIHGWLVCSHRHCVDDSQDQCAWPCETAVALGMNEGSET